MKLKFLLFQLTLVLLATQSIGQIKWRVNQLYIGVTPYTGSLSYASYLDNYHYVSRAVIGSGFIPDVDLYPIQTHRGGLAKSYRHLSVGLSFNPVNSETKQLNEKQRIDLGFTYLPALGRSIEHAFGELAAKPPIGTVIRDVNVRLTEHLDQLHLYGRYQIRISPIENSLKIYVGLDLRIGTEFNNRVIRVERRNFEITGYNSDSSSMYSNLFTIRAEVPVRRSIYMTTLVPITFERNLNSFFSIYGTASYGWGYRIHNTGRGYVDPYSTGSLEFGLRYNFRRSHARL